MAKDAYYFSHDSNAKDDPKCVLLIDQLGLEGYGIYWILIETLRDQPGYKYPLSLIPALARRYNSTAEKIRTVVNNYCLFVIDDHEFFSLSLIDRMQRLDNKREQARFAGIESAKKRLLVNGRSTDVQRTFNGRSTTVQPVKESKVNKSKVNESKEDESTVNETHIEAVASTRVPYSEIGKLFNSLCPSLPKITRLSEARKKAISARWKEVGGDMREFEELFVKTERSDFLAGRSKDWQASFDWLMKPTNFSKVLDGNYENRQRENETMAGIRRFLESD